jgi:hypothetical protein
VGVAEKRFCGAKTFGARGSGGEEAYYRAKIFDTLEPAALPLLNLLTVVEESFVSFFSLVYSNALLYPAEKRPEKG